LETSFIVVLLMYMYFVTGRAIREHMTSLKYRLICDWITWL